MKFPKTKTKNQYVRFMTYWNGSVLFLEDMTLQKYNKFSDLLKEGDFFNDTDNINEAIDWLNSLEQRAFDEAAGGSYYTLDWRESVQATLMINSLIKRGIVNNDNKTGFLVVKSNKPLVPMTEAIN